MWTAYGNTLNKWESKVHTILIYILLACLFVSFDGIARERIKLHANEKLKSIKVEKKQFSGISILAEPKIQFNKIRKKPQH